MSREPQACLSAANAESISASLVTSSGSDELRAQRLGQRLDAFLELLVDVGERELGAFAMHGLGDAPGDGTIGRDADDQRALAAQEPHVVCPLADDEAGILPASPEDEGRNQRRRTLTVSFWPGRSIDWLADAVPVDQVGHRDAEHLARCATACRRCAPCSSPGARCPTTPTCRSTAQRECSAPASGRRAACRWGPCRSGAPACDVHAMALGDAPQRIAAAHHVHRGTAAGATAAAVDARRGQHDLRRAG